MHTVAQPRVQRASRSSCATFSMSSLASARETGATAALLWKRAHTSCSFWRLGGGPATANGLSAVAARLGRLVNIAKQARESDAVCALTSHYGVVAHSVPSRCQRSRKGVAKGRRTRAANVCVRACVRRQAGRSSSLESELQLVLFFENLLFLEPGLPCAYRALRLDPARTSEERSCVMLDINLIRRDKGGDPVRAAMHMETAAH